MVPFEIGGADEMQNQSRKIPFGLYKGRMVSPHEVERGRACGCTCPECGASLVARKGARRRHHFAHESDVDCAGGGETAIHRMSKQVLMESKFLTLPEYHGSLNVVSPDEDAQPQMVEWTFPRQQVELCDTRIEPWQGQYRPDVSAVVLGRPLDIEIRASHEVDEAKRQLLTDQGRWAMEIDLSSIYRSGSIVTYEDLSEAVLKTANRIWINVPDDSHIREAQKNDQYLLDEALGPWSLKIRKLKSRKLGAPEGWVFRSRSRDWREEVLEHFVHEDELEQVSAETVAAYLNEALGVVFTPDEIQDAVEYSSFNDVHAAREAVELFARNIPTVTGFAEQLLTEREHRRLNAEIAETRKALQTHKGVRNGAKTNRNTHNQDVYDRLVSLHIPFHPRNRIVEFNGMPVVIRHGPTVIDQVLELLKEQAVQENNISSLSQSDMRVNPQRRRDHGG